MVCVCFLSGISDRGRDKNGAAFYGAERQIGWAGSPFENPVAAVSPGLANRD
jgi:hypothetical protein